MQKRQHADTTVCLNFCTYFKPGKNEDLACQGFMVVHGIVRNGKGISLDRPERIASPSAKVLAGLKERVCAVCSFRADGCDFAETGGAAPSCGGFALLAHLLGSGAVTLGDIDEAC